MEVGGLDDFHQLAILEVIIINLMLSLDVGKAIFLQQLVGLAVNGSLVLDTMLYELVLMAQEDVLSYSKAGQGAQLLHDNGNTLQICLNLVPWMNLLAIQNEFAAAYGINAGQHIGQGGFA